MLTTFQARMLLQKIMTSMTKKKYVESIMPTEKLNTVEQNRHNNLLKGKLTTLQTSE